MIKLILKDLNMKYITILLIFINSVSYSQDTTAAPDFIFCEIVGMSKLFTTKLDVSISYGQSLGIFRDNRIRNEDGEKVSFNSMIDAMNYMGERGWEFVQAYAVTMSNTNVYHYVLKRKLEGDDKTNYIPYIKRDFKK